MGKKKRSEAGGCRCVGKKMEDKMGSLLRGHHMSTCLRRQHEEGESSDGWRKRNVPHVEPPVYVQYDKLKDVVGA